MVGSAGLSGLASSVWLHSPPSVPYLPSLPTLSGCLPASDETASSSGACVAPRPSGSVRSRPFVPPIRVSGQFLALTGSFRPAKNVSKASLPKAAGTVGDAPVPATSSAQAAQTSVSAPVVAEIQIVVPKRLVRSAVKRNTVKRVLREAWLSASGMPQAQGKLSLLACPDRIWRFSLKAHPGGALLAKSQHARAQLRRAVKRAAASLASSAPPTESPLLAAQGFARHKRQLRAEADALLADAARKLAEQRPASAARSGQSSHSDCSGGVRRGKVSS